jgi:hypothetical protein
MPVWCSTHQAPIARCGCVMDASVPFAYWLLTYEEESPHE